MKPDPNTLNIIRDILSYHLRPPGDFISGFADLNGLADWKFDQYRFGISIGKRLDPNILAGIKNGPTAVYYDHYRAMNDELSHISDLITCALEQAGIPAMKIAPSVSTYDLDSKYGKTLRAELSHKMVATRAGLGWIGKTALFVSKKFGPGLRLVTILTTTPLRPSSRPVDKSRCGTCTKCVDGCPAGAANGILWDITVDRDMFFDPYKCREQCEKFGDDLKQNIRICGICIAVCPNSDSKS